MKPFDIIALIGVSGAVAYFVLGRIFEGVVTTIETWREPVEPHDGT